jgi:hypothetical protein
MRELMLPGLIAVKYRYQYIDPRWGAGLFEFEQRIEAPHVWIPKVGLTTAVAVGAAAAIIKNPEVSRRGLVGWLPWMRDREHGGTHEKEGALYSPELL